MCLIIAMPHKVEVKTQQLVNGARNNSDGIGLAWLDDKGAVQWRKGLSLRTLLDIIPTVPAPLMVHFRQATSGEKSGKLCHPFPLTRGVDVSLGGHVRRPVLMHNGHFGAAEEMALELAIRKDVKLPGGPWSDSRAIAWLAAHKGIGILDLMPGKFAVLGPRKPYITLVGSWAWENGVAYSNDSFRYQFSAAWKNGEEAWREGWDAREEI